MDEPLVWALTGAFCLVMGRLILKWAAEDWRALQAETAREVMRRMKYTHADATDICTAFHDVMNQPKPYYVRLHEWMERRHV